MLDRRRACHAGSRAHVDQCAAEIGGIERGGIHQGQECDSRGEALFEERAKLRGQRIWARGFFVDTVGRDTETIRKYIAEQEMEDRRLDQLEMPEITRE